MTDLLGAAGRFISGVEVEDDGLALVLGERHRLAVLVFQGEIGRDAALGHLQSKATRTKSNSIRPHHE